LEDLNFGFKQLGELNLPIFSGISLHFFEMIIVLILRDVAGVTVWKTECDLDK